jgi:hypothetical protein
MKLLRIVALLVFACVALARGQTNPNLGAGIDGNGLGSLTNAYVDMMKQAGDFTSNRAGNPAATLDANGWPTEDFYVMLQWLFQGQGNIYNGTYKLTFTGRADLGSWGFVTVANKVYNATTNTTTADIVLNAPVTPDNAFAFFTLTFSNTGGGVKNIRLIRPGHAADTTQLFTTQFLNHTKRFPVYRFMDWTHTNGNTSVHWTDRTPPKWPSYATRQGVPWEACIRLANTNAKDAWINVPCMATDDYVLKLARLFKFGSDASGNPYTSQQTTPVNPPLGPNRRLYLEFSNEVWNGGFPQYNQNKNAAIAEVRAGGSNLALPGEIEGVHDYLWAMRRTAKRLKQMRDIFASVYGEAAMNDVVRPVLADQVAWTETFKQALEFIERSYGPPKNYFYAVAGAPYFNMGNSDTATNLTKDQVLDALSASVTSYKNRYQSPEIHKMVALGVYYGLGVLAYEGGPDTFGGNNLAAKKAAHLDPRMREICVRYLNDWYGYGGELFMWFVCGAGNWDRPYGAWQLTNDMANQTAPKILAMDDVLNAPMPPVTAGVAVPATIDARDYIGVGPDWQTANPYLQNLNQGDEFNYLLRSSTASSSRIKLRMASTTTGSTAELLLNGSSLGLVAVPNTGGWSTFQPTAEITGSLRAGLNVLRVRVKSHRAYNIQAVEVSGSAPPVIGAIPAQYVQTWASMPWKPSPSPQHPVTNTWSRTRISCCREQVRHGQSGFHPVSQSQGRPKSPLVSSTAPQRACDLST